jgi:hypothetical protein
MRINVGALCYESVTQLLALDGDGCRRRGGVSTRAGVIRLGGVRSGRGREVLHGHPSFDDAPSSTIHHEVAAASRRLGGLGL